MEKVTQYKLYHYHRIGVYDEVWQVGNEFDVDKNFLSNFGTQLSGFSTAVCCSDGQKYPFTEVISDVILRRKYESRPDYARQVLNQARLLLHNAELYIRESNLERYRLEHYPDLPSRFHSIWTTNERGLNFWRSQLFNQEGLELYELSFSGNLFVSSDRFLPNHELTISEIYDASENYWNPNPELLEEDDRIECLVEGRVKIKKRISNRR